MDVVDCQVHLHHKIDIDTCLAVMDALGIQGVLIDEVWMSATTVANDIELSNGARRVLAGGALMATTRYPDRFKYLLRVHHRDPDLSAVVRLAGGDPNCLALRTRGDRLQEPGDYVPLFEQAAELGLPLFILVFGRSELLEPVLRRVPECHFVIDHVGQVESAEAWKTLLSLASYPNVSLKWCHADRPFPADRYPFKPMQAALREAVDAFGPQRVMWASDSSMLPAEITWADALYAVRECDLLSEEERRWVLGRAIRTLLGWAPPLTRPESRITTFAPANETRDP
jgi:predicted TIM-barrel fold metal-dependent hydrolase